MSVLSNMSESSPTGRVPLRGEAHGDEALAAIYARATAAAGRVPALYQALANAPAQLRGWTDLAWALRAEARSDRALRELAILRCAYLVQSSYVWCSHVRLADAAGVSERQVAAITDWRAHHASYSPAVQAVLTVTDELAGPGAVSDEAWRSAAQHLDPGALVEVVLTISWYLHVARVVDTLGVPPEEYHARVTPLPPRALDGPSHQEQ